MSRELQIMWASILIGIVMGMGGLYTLHLEGKFGTILAEERGRKQTTCLVKMLSRDKSPTVTITGRKEK